MKEKVNWWKEVYSVGRDVQINGIVSPGNQKGGLANILEKSLGSAMKGGTSGLMEVYNYAEKVTKKGFQIWIIPHTYKETNLSFLNQSSLVNIEIDSTNSL